jgi:hypothetical protein
MLRHSVIESNGPLMNLRDSSDRLTFVSVCKAMKRRERGTNKKHELRSAVYILL